MGEQQAEFAERTVDILESKIDNLQETLYKEKLNYRIRLNDIEMSYLINKVKLSNGKVALAPSLCGENCFRVIRDMSDCISFPDERNESLLVIFKKPI